MTFTENQLHNYLGRCDSFLNLTEIGHCVHGSLSRQESPNRWIIKWTLCRSSSGHWSLSGHGSSSGNHSLSGKVTAWTWVIEWYNVPIFQTQSYIVMHNVDIWKMSRHVHFESKPPIRQWCILDKSSHDLLADCSNTTCQWPTGLVMTTGQWSVCLVFSTSSFTHSC